MVEGSAPSSVLLAALAIPECAAPRDKPLPTGRDAVLMKATPLQDAHKAALHAGGCAWPEELDWTALLTWEVYPLRAFPHLVKHALRRLPAIQPAGLAAAAAAKPEDAEAAALDSRNELVQLVGLNASAP